MAEKQIFVRKKGAAGVKFLLTLALKPLLDKGDLEIITDEEMTAENKKAESTQHAPARFLRRRNSPAGSPYFPWTEALSKVPDFEEYILPKETVKATESPEDTNVQKQEEDNTIPEPEEKKEVEKITVEDVEAMKDLPDANDPADTPEETENNKEKMLIGAIKSLDPEKDFTKQTPLSEPKPKVEVLEEKVGFKVTANMRDVAWLAYQELEGE